MKRRSTQPGLGDDSHRSEVAGALSEAEVRLKRFARAASCRDRALQLGRAAETLAEASAHQLSIEAASLDDKRRAARLRDLSSAYQRAWAQFRRRCTRSQ